MTQKPYDVEEGYRRVFALMRTNDALDHEYAYTQHAEAQYILVSIYDSRPPHIRLVAGLNEVATIEIDPNARFWYVAQIINRGKLPIDIEWKAAWV